MKKKENNSLKLEITTVEIMIISLYNSIKDIVKAISPKTEIDELETWIQKCEDSAKKLLESESDK